MGPASAPESLGEMTGRQMETLANRLASRVRHFRKWPEKQGTDAYRLFHHDIPDVPIIVERWGEHGLVIELMGPRNRRTGIEHDRWLDEACRVTAGALSIPREAVHLRRRFIDRNAPAPMPRWVSVHENGMTLAVDLAAASGPSILQSRRGVRAMVRDLSDGKRVLCIGGGPAAVFALAGGAVHVDALLPSTPAIEPLRRAMEANALEAARLTFLVAAQPPSLPNPPLRARAFDLVMVDPSDWPEGGPVSTELVSSLLAEGGSAILVASAGSEAPAELAGWTRREVSKRVAPADAAEAEHPRCWRLTPSQPVDSGPSA